MEIKRTNSKHGSRGFLIGLIVVLAISAVFLACVIWLLLAPQALPVGGTPIVSEPPAATTATTVTTTTTATTTATTTKTANGTTTATVAPLLGENGLLQYDPAGHYVQKGVSDWRLILVNDWNAISSDYEKSITLAAVGSQKVDSRILADLNAMLTAGKAHGIGVQSGYRPYQQQSTLYWRQVNKFLGQGHDNTKAQTIAGTIVKRPGYSEHNCGLAVDLGGSGNFKLEEDFADTPAYRWLIEHCADYGFVLRFPKGKEAVTGVIYEPWHYRYVGKEAAAYIMQNGLCFEEYLEQKSAENN